MGLLKRVAAGRGRGAVLIVLRVSMRLSGWKGEEGVTRVSVGLSLGLTSKRASRALAAFAAKYRIRETFAQQGKAQIKVCCPEHADL